MSHVFISYSRMDSETVDNIVARLSKDEFNIWLDRNNIKGGDLWREAIVEAVDNAYAFVLMLSPDSVASDNVRKEVDLAEGADKALVPIVLAPVKLPSRLRYQLAGIQYIEYHRDPAAKYAELIEVLRDHQQKYGMGPIPVTREVEIILKGLKLSQFDHEKQEQLLYLIADFTGTPRAELSVEEVRAGSVHVFVKMPAGSAYQLKTAALNRQARLIAFGIEALRLRGDRHFVSLKTGSIVPPKSGGSGSGPWLMGGLALMIAVLIASLFISGALSLNGLFATIVPTLTKTLSPTPSRTLTATATSSNTPTLTSTPTLTRTPTLIPIVATTPALACSPVLLGLKNANCRIGPSKAFDPPYGTLMQGQSVHILAVNLEHTWFLVEHPQSFRSPCWVSNGSAVEVKGDLSCVQELYVPVTGPSPSAPHAGRTAKPPPDNPPPPASGPTIQISPYLFCYIRLLNESCPPAYMSLDPCYCNNVPK